MTTAAPAGTVAPISADAHLRWVTVGRERVGRP